MTDVIKFPTQPAALEQRVVDGLLSVFFAEYPHHLDQFKPYVVAYFEEETDDTVLTGIAEQLAEETELADWLGYISLDISAEDVYRNAMEMILVGLALDDMEKLKFLLDMSKEM